MAGDIWEQAVETYLAMDRWLFLNPEYFIGEPKVWESYADFLAICVPDKTAWMVEVTKRAAGLRDKIEKFSKDYEGRIRKQLITAQIIPEGDTGWKIGFWAFVPRDGCKETEDRLRKAALQVFKVTALEETLEPSAWDKRFRG
ncbi:MAG: hypothetical protein ACLPKT_20380 [Methylocella sp.]